MEISDDALINLFRINPRSVPTVKISRCLQLLDESDRDRLMATITQRKPRTDRERQALLYFAQSKGAGGILFIDALGGFEGQLPN